MIGPVDPADTVRGVPLDGVPLDPFCTVTVKLPAPRVVLPLKLEELFAVSELPLTVQVEAVHPGPLKTIMALFRSKPVPVMVNVNAWALMGGFGEVAIPLS